MLCWLARPIALTRPFTFLIVLQHAHRTLHRTIHKEALVVEKLATNVTFAKDGTGQREQTYVIRVQSDAAVRELGVLASPIQRGKRASGVRLRAGQESRWERGIDAHFDGSGYSRPKSPGPRRPTAICGKSRSRSGHSSAGDVLEYQVRAVRTKPDVPNQFRYTHDFFKGGIVLEETLRIVIPAGQYVKVKSPALNPQLEEENGQKELSLEDFEFQAASEPEKDTKKNRGG